MKYSLNELLDFANEENPNVNFEILYKMIEDKNYEIRMCICELLSYDTSEKAKEILLDVIKEDDNELVRAEAADAISFFNDINLIDGLFQRLKLENINLVRSYLLFAILDISNNGDFDILDEIKHLFETEKDLEMKIICAGFLYTKKEMNMLDFLLDNLKNENFYIRRLATNEIVKICSDNNINYIKEKIKDYNFDKENSVDIKDNLYAILSYKAN